ncbi:MAG: hypothetical protein KF850_18760 [Labilithrix sp.]|nr:hypothetical protein [Labilithrix sp.]MBX3214084.1 hypothetical protein [Labilithrix sp.]
MLATYGDGMSMREAREVYFAVNGFGETGGYDDAWVDFKLGPIPMPFPNTRARVEAVRYHDLHHLLTSYDTDIVGELEIAAWEIAAGCRSYGAAWVLNLAGTAAGMLRAPRRVFAAFVRGRGQRTAYGEDLDALLAMSVREARERFTRAAGTARRATLLDVLLFAATVAVGLVVALLLFALVVPLVPFGLLAHAARRRRARDGGAA